VNIVHHSYAILFTAVSIKNIVDMSSNKNLLKHTHVRCTGIATPTNR